MKEFISAVEDDEALRVREDKIKTLMQETPGNGDEPAKPGLSREEAETQVDTEGESYTEFKLDDRVMRAYQPHEGQLVFMLAAMGRGQSKEQRFSAILNIMFSSLRDDDKDYLEGRLLTRDPKHRVKIEKIEQIFEYLTEEWFGESRPTQPSSGSAE